MGWSNTYSFLNPFHPLQFANSMANLHTTSTASLLLSSADGQTDLSPSGNVASARCTGVSGIIRAGFVNLALIFMSYWAARPLFTAHGMGHGARRSTTGCRWFTQTCRHFSPPPLYTADLHSGKRAHFPRHSADEKCVQKFLARSVTTG